MDWLSFFIGLTVALIFFTILRLVLIKQSIEEQIDTARDVKAYWDETVSIGREKNEILNQILEKMGD